MRNLAMLLVLIFSTRQVAFCECTVVQWACSNCGFSCCPGGAGCTTVTTEFQPFPSLTCRPTLDNCCGGNQYREISTTTQGTDCDGRFKVTTNFMCCAYTSLP